jgi:hypothetical protein
MKRLTGKRNSDVDEVYKKEMMEKMMKRMKER